MLYSLGLDGIRVMDVSGMGAGPLGARLLADWGADVIHVEHPVRGDILRSIKRRPSGGRIESDIDYSMQNFNRNKRGMTLDLSQEGGREIFYKLLEKTDVFLSNFRPRELEKFKLEYKTLSQLNPRLICANLTGYGRKGPEKDAPGFDTTAYFSRAGILHVIQAPGSPPAQVPGYLGDNVVALALACGIMTALFLRERTGIGQEVDVSLFHTGVFTLSFDVAGALVTGQDRQPAKRRDMLNALLNVYQTKDGRWLRFHAMRDTYWPKFCQAIEREDLEHDPRFESLESRIENNTALFNILEEVFLSKTLAEWKVRLKESGVPWGPVQSLPEVITDPQARANDFFVPLDHPTYGRIEVVTSPVRLSKTPEKITIPAPEFNQHTEEVLLEHGYTWGDIERFKEQGIIA